jgi:ABC-2 type transport system ATP-binding protein
MDVAHSNIVLSLRGLKKSYGDLLAVNDLALDIFRGEVLGLLGPNGAGKTTTINIICGLVPCDAGEVLLDGRSLKGRYQDYKQMIGLYPQEVVIWEALTCLEQLELVGRLYDVRPAVTRNRAIELLSVFGLLDRKHKLARTLSAGMKRRLNLALALVHDPPMLILDEPQAELDPQSRILVREYIRSLGSGKTVLLCTHDMDEADRLADRIAIIDHGRLLVVDTSEGLKKRIGAGDILEIRIAEGQEDELNRLQQALPDSLLNLACEEGTLRLVGVDTPDVLPPLLDRLRSAHLQIQDMTIRKKTLEDVFIALTGRRLRE